MFSQIGRIKAGELRPGDYLTAKVVFQLTTIFRDRYDAGLIGFNGIPQDTCSLVFPQDRPVRIVCRASRPVYGRWDHYSAT
jgi:hypothetical protein